MDETTPDSALWLEAVSGSETSFGIIFDRYRRLVFRKAYARVQDVTDAEDIVAIVFMEAWRKRDDVRFVDGSLRPWLLVVTVNVTMNRNRANRRYRMLIAKLPAPEAEPDHSERTLARFATDQAMMALREGLKRLSSSDQRIIELCLIEELSPSTVAAALQLPVGTVKSKLSRAKSRLRVDLEPFAPGQEGAPA